MTIDAGTSVQLKIPIWATGNVVANGTRESPIHLSGAQIELNGTAESQFANVFFSNTSIKATQQHRVTLQSIQSNASYLVG